MPIAPMHEHDYARVAQHLPPTDEHELVLLTMFEMFGTRVRLDEQELADVLDMDMDELRSMAIDLCDTGWIAELPGYTGYYIHEDQADLINKRYPNCLDRT